MDARAKKARRVVVQSLETLASAELDAENERNILRIVKALYENPEKISKALVFAETDAFRRYHQDSVSFHRTVIRMHRVPKKILCQGFAGGISVPV